MPRAAKDQAEIGSDLPLRQLSAFGVGDTCSLGAPKSSDINPKGICFTKIILSSFLLNLTFESLIYLVHAVIKLTSNDTPRFWVVMYL